MRTSVCMQKILKTCCNVCLFLFFFSKGWDLALNLTRSKKEHWALYAKSVLDRTRLALANKAEAYHRILQPSAEYLGSLLGVEEWAVCPYFVTITMCRFKLPGFWNSSSWFDFAG